MSILDTILAQIAGLKDIQVSSDQVGPLLQRAGTALQPGDVDGADFGNIGVPGQFGFGAGPCPPEYLPVGYYPMLGYRDVTHDNYGNYLHAKAGQVAFVPTHYMRIGHPDNPTYATYGANSVDVQPYSAFTSESAANAAGYFLPRACRDGGFIQPGYFTGKVMASPSADSTHATHVIGGVPISLTLDADYTDSGSMSGCDGYYYDAITLSRAIGDGWQSTNAFILQDLAFISLAHAQAATSTAACAWYDETGTTNYPKGCDDAALGSTDDASLIWTTAGDAGDAAKPLTGSCSDFARSTHNGQRCGIADLAGSLWDLAIGVTTPGASATDATEIASSDLYALRPQTRIADLTAGWDGATDAWQSAANIEGLYQRILDGMWWGATVGWTNIGNGAAAAFSDAISGDAAALRDAGVPLQAGTGPGANLYGGDGLYTHRRANLALLAGGTWHTGAKAGVLCRFWFYYRRSRNPLVGFRASAYVL